MFHGVLLHLITIEPLLVTLVERFFNSHGLAVGGIFRHGSLPLRLRNRLFMKGSKFLPRQAINIEVVRFVGTEGLRGLNIPILHRGLA